MPSRQETHTLSVRLPAGQTEIDYVDVRGARPGPHLTVIAGIHGTEYTSIAAAREFARSVDGERLSGRVTVVPVVNVTAFWARAPFVVPEDGRNLNRSFPGDADGSAAEILADAVNRHFIRGSDALLDLHAGDLPEALEPFALYDESPVQDGARELALAYGLGHVVRQSRSARTVGGSTSATAADLGIPSITAEAGQCGILDRPSVHRHLRGLRNVCRSLGLVDEPVEAFPAPAEHDGWLWLRSDRAGWWQPAVAVGAPVTAGQVLGTVGDLVGDQVGDRTDTVTAPADGVPLFITSSPAVQQDGLLLGLALPAGPRP